MKIRLHFLHGNTRELELHYDQKSYRHDVIVEINGLFYEVYFFMYTEMGYEMSNDGYFSFPGLILLDEISTPKIITAVRQLATNGYFDAFKGHKELPLNDDRFMHRWYITGKDSTKDMATIALDI